MEITDLPHDCLHAVMLERPSAGTIPNWRKNGRRRPQPNAGIGGVKMKSAPAPCQRLEMESHHQACGAISLTCTHIANRLKSILEVVAFGDIPLQRRVGGLGIPGNDRVVNILVVLRRAVEKRLVGHRVTD